MFLNRIDLPEGGALENTDVEGARKAGVSEVAILTAVKTALKQQVDVSAEAQRLKYITPGAGQAMTYQRKLEQARAASAEQSPKPADYPLLAASVDIDGADIAAVAAVVIGMDAQWEIVGSAIERVRLGAKKSIDEAADVTAALAAFNAVAWPNPQS